MAREYSEVQIDKIEIGDRIRKDLGDVDDLKESITELGLLQPIVVNKNKKLLAGHRRLTACTALGWKRIPATIVDGFDELQEFDVELQENIKRKQFNPIEEAEALQQRKELYERLHPETKIGGAPPKKDGKGGKNVKITGLPSFVESTAQVTGFSKSAIEKKLQLNALPEAYKQNIRDGNLKVSQAVRKVKIEQQKVDIPNIKPPEGKFNMIVIDPPWEFKAEYDPNHQRLAGDYPTMSIEEVKKIKLPAADDCVLWLWGVDTYLKETLEVIEAWGFERKGTLIWVKDKIGLGRWLRNQHEYCFLAIKGNPKIIKGDVSSIFNAPRKEHSEKPDAFYVIVEKMCPYKRKLDYFARKKREGWEVYGDEVK